MASVPAQGAVWSIAPQLDRLGDATVDVTGSTWYRFRAANVTGGGMQDQTTLPLELGGVLTPTGGYKSGAYFMQEVDLIPRLEDTLGYLLYATLGNVSSISGQKYGAAGWSANAGAYGHLFRFNPTDQASIPWFATRLRVPGVSSGEVFGEVGMDCKASGLRLNIPGAGLITGRFGAQGRKFIHPAASDVNAWTYENNFERSRSIAHSGEGSLTIGSTIPKVTGLTIDFVNTLTRPQDEFIVGDFFPDDVAVLTRSVRMRAAMKWENSAIWRQLFNGGASETEWSTLPYFSETAGAVRGFYFEAKSPDVMPSLTEKYVVRVMANNVMMSVDPGSLRLRPGGIIEYMVNIDVLDPEEGEDYIQIALDNLVTGYTWS